MVATDGKMKQRVDKELQTLVRDINEKRKLGELALDPGIEFRYPSVNVDYCQRAEHAKLRCATVGYTAELSKPIVVDVSWGYSLHMKSWFFVGSTLFGLILAGCVTKGLQQLFVPQPHG
eukprot:3540374-Amphidinium_carterae.1